MTIDTLTLIQPDDWHCHFRDGEALSTTVTHTAQCFARAIVMPNLVPPVTEVTAALAYQQRIIEAIPDGCDFKPLMTLYLRDDTHRDTLLAAKDNGIIAGKLYPAGATTNSQLGVQNISQLYPVFDVMQTIGMKLLVHGELTDPTVDIFDREAVFIGQILDPIVKEFPKLKVVLEHISTKEAVDYIIAAPNNVAATITAHHLLINRNDLLSDEIKPHYYCLPIVKSQTNQAAIRQAAVSGHPKFFLGTDSAPHAKHTKESTCGCAGIYTAHAALALYAEVFDAHNALDKLEGFTSRFGAEFYELDLNQQSITLHREAIHIPDTYSLGDDTLVPFRAGEAVAWKVV